MRRLNMDFDDEMVKKIDEMKKHYGITQTTELVRFILSSNYWNIKASKIARGEYIRKRRVQM